VDRVTVRACIAAVLDEGELGVGWTKNMVMVQVKRRIKLLESHIAD
jgi:hypothetical protein